MRRPRSASCCGLLIGLCALAVLTTPTHAQTFTLDAATAPANGVAPDDLLLPGGPALLLPGATGIIGPPPVDVDAFTYSQVFGPGYSIVGVDFSVTPGSIGLPATAVFGESGGVGGLDEPADIFVSGLGGGNAQFADGNGVPVGPAVALGVIEPGTNVNGWDATGPFGPVPGIYYSVSAADVIAHPVFGGASAADIFFSPPVPGYSVTPALYASAASLGLLPGDDIDALAIIDDGTLGPSPGNDIYFSLTPGSPTLAALGVGPGEILLTKIGGAPVPIIPVGALGLAPTDDVDALDLAVIPEPSTLMLLMVGGTALLYRRKPSD